MTESASPTELAWAAGFIDGEGCVTIALQRYPNRRNPTFRPHLSVSQNHLASLERLRTILGVPATIYLVKRRPYHSRQMWMLPLNGKRAMAALSSVEPYLVRKGPEVEILRRLWTECDLQRYPGPKGFPKETWDLRWQLYYQIRSMH